MVDEAGDCKHEAEWEQKAGEGVKKCMMGQISWRESIAVVSAKGCGFGGERLHRKVTSPKSNLLLYFFARLLPARIIIYIPFAAHPYRILSQHDTLLYGLVRIVASGAFNSR